MTGEVVHYNYPLMEGVATQLMQNATVAQALLDAGRAGKQTLLGSFHGDTANTFQDCFSKFEHVCQDTIEVIHRGVNAYHAGLAGMQQNERQSQAMFA